MQINKDLVISGTNMTLGDIAYKDIYSKTETKTNKVWVDGKPIYRKVINYVLTDANTWGYTNHNISNLGVCINQKTMLFYNNTYYDAPNDFLIEVNVGKKAVGYYCTNSFAGYGGFTILEYTKTTD